MTIFKIKWIYFLASFFAMVFFSGCQKEHVKINDPDKAYTISEGDTLAELILRVTLFDGSFDNVIDHCSAISIKFPYTIQINEQIIQINSLDDLELIKQDSLLADEEIEIVYPITIIYSDYSESVISNEDELEALQIQYNAHLDDEDIECLDFVYPIQICTYITLFQNANCITIENDFELNTIFSDLSELLVEIEFPIQVRTADNFTIRLNDNTELEAEIKNYINSCDEDDEVEFEEESDSIDINGEVASDIIILTTGRWSVMSYNDESDEAGDTISFTSYLIKFNTDFTIEASSETETFEGTWELYISESIETLQIEFNTDNPTLESINDEWEILVINDDTVELQAESDSEGFLKKLNLSKSD